jgi:virulence-associated protein VagC
MAEHRYVRLFRNGRNQAVRIPVEFELPGNDAIMHRDGDRLVIEPVRKRGGWRDMQPRWSGGRSRFTLPAIVGAASMTGVEAPANS